MSTKLSSSSTNDRVSSLFQPDTLLTEQYMETQRRNTPIEHEKRLMIAILEDAVACFQKNFTAERRKEKTLFQELEEWFMEKESDWLFSFEGICQSLGLDPDYVRKGLMQWKERQQRPKAKIYHLNTLQRKQNHSSGLSKSSTHKPRNLKSGTE